ncbi:hypothetical protein ANCDUO_22791 [Ancylostoma duodenale]|uniref:Diacylglycerol kinase type I N-terminal domain-containing protein n=1 Tax=Ancylostoma duodenale TaxID=51022 RepID=A0A0C2FQC9_9BILA|nr:hypothetical protein ANCDUO_22791 [Ancylostoma duodenale]
MLVEFQPEGKFYSYLDSDDQGNQTINFQGFKEFLSDYFEADLPSELIQQLSLSFSKGPPTGKSLVECIRREQIGNIFNSNYK